MFITFEICSLQSRMLSFPSSSFFAISFCLSGFWVARSCMCSISPCISPRPKSLEMKGCGENRSRSCKCSPTPRKMIGVCVVATLKLKRRLVLPPCLLDVGRTHAEMAPPPFACPSIFVTMIAPKSADSLNARLCASAAWPVENGF